MQSEQSTVESALGYPLAVALSIGVLFQFTALVAMIVVTVLDKRNEAIEKANHAAQIRGINDSGDGLEGNVERLNVQNMSIIQRLKDLGSTYAFFSLLMFFEFICLVPFATNLNLLLQTRFSIDSV